MREGTVVAIRTEQEYEEAVERLNALVDEVGNNPQGPRYRFIEAMSGLLRAFDEEDYRLEEEDKK